MWRLKKLTSIARSDNVAKEISELVIIILKMFSGSDLSFFRDHPGFPFLSPKRFAVAGWHPEVRLMSL